ncbi:hypothetical protein [Arcobacter sp.]|uniref:hypothetical protein n=1 Tax=Arcobacter sp. TaxID=1872629 RepID=UPI003D13AB92
MNLLISLFYAPAVFYSLRNFELKTVSLIIFIFSFIWLVFSIKKSIKEYIFPLFYLFVSILAYFLDNFLFLKILPLLISGLISIYILYSYIHKNSFIFIFLEKFNKKIEEEEKVYIHKSTFFWFVVSLSNVLIHSFVLYSKDMLYWTFYSSIGWYFLFIVAGIMQFIHKKVYFEAKVHV